VIQRVAIYIRFHSSICRVFNEILEYGDNEFLGTAASIGFLIDKYKAWVEKLLKMN
jgi:hypothetical protein